MTASQNLGAQLSEKQKALADFYMSHKTTDVERPYGMTAEEVEKVKSWNKELDDLGKQWEEAKGMEAIEVKNRELGERLSVPVRPPFASGKVEKEEDVKSLGEVFVDACYKDGRARKHQDIEVKNWGHAEFKTTMTTAAGFMPQNLRSGKLVLSAQRPIKVPDILPMIGVSTGNAYTYMAETTFTNNAAEIAEAPAGVFGEAALAYSEASATIRKIAVFLPVTDEQLADVAGMGDLINNRLTLMLQLRLDSQLLNGDNVPPNIDGFYDQIVQAQAKGADPTFDAVYKGMTKVRWTGMADPTAIVLHPNDWQDIRLTRTLDGIYILGNPSEPGTERLWGVPVVVTSAAVENTGLVGDFLTHSALVYRQGIEFKISDSHDTYFIKGLQAVRCTMRAALVVFRVAAFCEVTGI